MTRFPTVLVFAFLMAAAPVWSQTTINAPAGWTTRTRTNGATTFSPPNLRAGEKYSVTIYDAAPLKGQTPDEYLRKFAGPVGNRPGQLVASLQTKAQGVFTSGIGVYIGSSGTRLGVMFIGLSLDGANIHALRILSSTQGALSQRYQVEVAALISSLEKRAKANKAQQEARQEAPQAAREAEPRFKWVTKPGKGVLDGHIAAVWLHSSFDLIGGHANSTVYLMLRDGSVYADLPVPPDELDTARSKAHEPEKWGKWRKTAQGYAISLGGHPFENVSGERVAPAPALLKFAGRYSGGSGGAVGGFSSYAFSGVIFGKDRRFKKGASGGASSTGYGARTDTSHDDQGASATASGPGYVAGSAQQKRNANGDHEGTYSLSGYVLTLRYDNGKIERLPFFFDGSGNGGRDALWFEGATLSLDNGK